MTEQEYYYFDQIGESDLVKHQKSSSRLIDHMEMQEANLRKFNISGLFDSRHLPSAKRISSRQTLHNVQYSADSTDAKNLIQVAERRLNSMERRRRQKNETANLQSIIYKSGKDPDGTGKSSVKSHLSR